MSFVSKPWQNCSKSLGQGPKSLHGTNLIPWTWFRTQAESTQRGRCYEANMTISIIFQKMNMRYLSKFCSKGQNFLHVTNIPWSRIIHAKYRKIQSWIVDDTERTWTDMLYLNTGCYKLMIKWPRSCRFKFKSITHNTRYSCAVLNMKTNLSGNTT